MSEIIVFSNHVDWGYTTIINLEKEFSAKIVRKRYPCKDNRFSEFLWKIVFSAKITKGIPGFIKRKFILSFLRQFSITNKSAKLIFYDHNAMANNEFFLKELKKINSKIELIYVFTNIIKYTAANDLNYVNKLNNWYDVVFAFDPMDAEKYGFAYSPLIYDADPNYRKENIESKEPLVFYVGQAKDRLPGLLSYYEKLKALGISCDFHIANVKEMDIRHADEIVYNKFMTYQECVDSIQKATCLIDVIQGDSSGLTIKTCEAVCYDKKLITTNKHVIEYPFYDPRYIRVVESPDDIDIQFLTENVDVHYSEEGKKYFSAETFLQRLENELNKV